MDGPGKTPITADEILAEDLYGLLLKSDIEAAPLPPPVIDRKLRAAEDHFEHAFHFLWQQTRIATGAARRALDPSTYDLDDTPLDYPADFYTAQRWGWLALNYRPLVSVSTFFITMPGVVPRPLINFPVEWVVPNYKAARLSLLPGVGQQPAFQLMGGGAFPGLFEGPCDVPRVVYVDYVAGFTPTSLRKDHNDVLEALRLYTVLLCFGIVTAIRANGAGSRSISFDGLSRSESFGSGKWGAFSGIIQLYTDQIAELMKPWVGSQQAMPLWVL